MKLFLSLVFMMFTFVSFSQDSFSEADAKQIINTFFDGFHKGDTLMMKSVLGVEVPLLTAFTDKEGNNRLKSESIDGLLDAIAKRPETAKWDERLLGYEVQIDGNLAHVWTPYEFWLNGNFSHCGANAFTLAKTDEGWRIIHLIDSRRKSSCKE